MSDISLASLPPEVRADVCRFLKIAQADAELVTLNVAADLWSPTCIICETYDYTRYLDGPLTRRILPMILPWRAARTLADLLTNDAMAHLLVPEAEARQRLFDLEAQRPSRRYLETGEFADMRLAAGVLPESLDGKFGKRITPKLAAERAAKEGAAPVTV